MLTSAARDYAVSHHALTCREVWASNRNVAHTVELPGLQGWIYSAPLELGFDGGDIHYLSACDYGLLSRVVLADVSGHGRSIAVVAEALLRLVRAHMNSLEQSALLMELSASLSSMKADDATTYATALVVGFDSTGGDLTVTDAGHPPPLWYRAAQRQWELLQKSESPQPGRPVGIPIGLEFPTRYEDLVVNFGGDDLLICYTDGISDATDDQGRALGVDGLLELARGLTLESPMAAGATLLGLVDGFRRGAPASDDETLIVLRRSA
jgi:sigma-B regulation protein RsbU (phosphoserine phosphatase)